MTITHTRRQWFARSEMGRRVYHLYDGRRPGDPLPEPPPCINDRDWALSVIEEPDGTLKCFSCLRRLILESLS